MKLIYITQQTFHAYSTPGRLAEEPILSSGKPAKRVDDCASWDSKYSEGYVEYKTVIFSVFAQYFRRVCVTQYIRH